MSAWLVTKAHIDAIVQTAIVEGLATMEGADDLGAALWLENHRSLHARYGDPIPEKIDYTYEGIESPLDPVKVYTLLRCYDYQTCEHDAWHDSTNPMATLVDTLASTFLDRLGGDTEIISRGPWGINDLREAV